MKYPIANTHFFKPPYSHLNPCAMDNVKTKKLTALISKLTLAANRAVKKHEANFNPRKQYSITGLNSTAAYNGRGLSFSSSRLPRP